MKVDIFGYGKVNYSDKSLFNEKFLNFDGFY